MKMLLRGGESPKRIRLLLKMTGIRSPDIKAAIESHLHLGMRESHAAMKHKVEQQNLNRALRKLNNLAKDYEDLKALGLQHLIILHRKSDVKN
jgi:hypothetical protein